MSGSLKMYSQPSAQAVLDAQCVPETAKTPGPGHYFGPENNGFSSFGEQKFSKCPSAPSLSFARTNWDKWQGVTISKGHEKSLRGRQCVGGPTYDVHSPVCARECDLFEKGTMGPAPKKYPPNDPVRLARSMGMDPHASPGPAYKIPDPWESLTNAPAKETFGKQDRFFIKRDGYKNLEYTRKDDSIKGHTGKSFGVGRAAYDRVIRPGWETEGQCKASPGIGPPMWSTIGDPVPSQTQADKARAQKGKFSNAQRFPAAADETCSPGPGKYDRAEGCLGISPPRRQNKLKEKIGTFGKKPVKPRFRPDLAMLCGKHGGWGYH